MPRYHGGSLWHTTQALSVEVYTTWSTHTSAQRKIGVSLAMLLFAVFVVQNINLGSISVEIKNKCSRRRCFIPELMIDIGPGLRCFLHIPKKFLKLLLKDISTFCINKS